MGEIWTCEGSVRGACGVAHRSEAAARRCCDRDASAVRRGNPGGGAYSDRRPVEGPPRGATVHIRVRSTYGFACWGVLRYRGEVVADTREYPYGHDASARCAAESIAHSRGWRVAP